MAKSITFEQFHLDVLIPRGLSDAEAGAIRRTLAARRFRARVERSVRAVFRKYPSLRKARIALTL